MNSHSWSPGRRAPIWLRAAETIWRPVITVHGLLYRMRMLRTFRPEVPVVSVGNLSVGGTGKTPCVIWLVKELGKRGETPVVLTRGYGRQSDEIVVLRPGVPAPGVDLTGDEPLEIFEATRIPVVIGRNRRSAARFAVETLDASCLVLDDGFQHRPIRRDFDLVLLDAALPFGNGHLLPAGPLREPNAALLRANALLLTRAGEAPDLESSRRAVESVTPGTWIGFADHRVTGFDRIGGSPTPPTAGEDPGLAPGTAVVLAAGVARPDSVVRSLEGIDVRVQETFLFPDHHRFSPGDLAWVVEASRGRPIVTTLKDAVRWRGVSGFPGDAAWWAPRLEFVPREATDLAELIHRGMRSRFDKRPRV